MKKLVLVLALVVAGCGGPSSKEVTTAKLTHYTAPPATLFQIAMQAAEQDYKIAETDQANGQFITAQGIYSAEGTPQRPGAGGYTQMHGNSIILQLIVEVVENAPGHMIVVTPKTFQMVPGSPKPRELSPDDPDLPGWVKGRVDALAVAIHDAAKPHAAP